MYCNNIYGRLELEKSRPEYSEASYKVIIRHEKFCRYDLSGICICYPEIELIEEHEGQEKQ